MNNFFKSRFFIITCTCAVILTVIMGALAVSGHLSPLTNIVNIAVVPFQRGFSAFGQALDGYRDYFFAFDELKAENEALRNQLDKLQDKVYDAQAILDENEFYKEFLDIKKENPDYEFLSADVIGREAGSFDVVFSLDKGSRSGVSVNMPVISSNGSLVGCITEVGANWSKASSIIDVSSAVGIYIERSMTEGVLCGEYSLQGDGMCRISYLPEDCDVQEGDRVITSGVGSIYPYGISVGTVQSVHIDDNLRSKYVVVKPFSQLSSPEKLMIITNFQAEE